MLESKSSVRRPDSADMTKVLCFTITLTQQFLLQLTPSVTSHAGLYYFIFPCLQLITILLGKGEKK